VQASSSSATSAQPHKATSKGSLSEEEEERRRVPLLPAEELATPGRGREIRDTMIDVVASATQRVGGGEEEEEGD
jgi:hypothetical protein